MSARTFGILLVLACAGCGGHDDYADEPDLPAVRAAFHCEQPSRPEEERACAALDRFERAGPVTDFPSAAPHVYLGRHDCSD